MVGIISGLLHFACLLLLETSMAKKGVPLSEMATSDTHGEDSPYFVGWKVYDENPYDAASNPSGVIQMGLAENQVSPAS